MNEQLAEINARLDVIEKAIAELMIEIRSLSRRSVNSYTTALIAS